MANGVADMFDEQSSSDGDSSAAPDTRGRAKTSTTTTTTRRRQYSEDEEEEEDDDDDRRSLSEESSDYERAKKKPAARKKKRARASNFLDIEASVDVEEEEEDDDEDGALGDFIVDNEAELASAERDALRHRGSGMRGPARVFAEDEEEEEDGEALEARLRARYSGYGDKHAPGGGRHMGPDSGGWVAQRLLIPGIRDPHLWACACAAGKERDVVLAAARRVFQWQGKGKYDGVFSCYCRDGLSGHVYVEARSVAEARLALEGIPGVFLSKLALVPLGDMVDVVRIKARAARINAGAWVRVKRGNYAGDLGQVAAVIEGSDSVEVRLLPRIDYDGSCGKGERPAPRLFSADDARRSKQAHLLASRQNEITWRGDRFVGGYLHKDMRVAGLALQAAPTLDEITRFAGSGGGDPDDAAAAIAESLLRVDVQADDLAPGDAVDVVAGDLAGMAGAVRSVSGDAVRVDVAGLRDAMSFSARQLRKRFAQGDHVKVLQGRHQGATGLVLVAAGAVVTVHADVGGGELRVLARDLRLTTDVSAGGAQAAAVVGLDVHDLVLVDGTQPAVVLRIAADALTVLDDRGETRAVPPRDARPMRMSSDRAGVDCAGAPVRRGDRVRETAGARREGSVLQVTRFVAF
ncbi:transcription elongation factor spt5, partial [Coemansia aciculifera]